MPTLLGLMCAIYHFSSDCWTITRAIGEHSVVTKVTQFWLSWLSLVPLLVVTTTLLSRILIRFRYNAQMILDSPEEHLNTAAKTATHCEEKEIKICSQPKRTIVVRLVVEPAALSQGHVKQSWLDSAKDHIKEKAHRNEKIDVTVEIESDSTHEAFCKNQIQQSPSTERDTAISDATSADSSVVTFLVIPAKQDREPFPEDCNMLQMGYLVQDRGDCDSIWIGSTFTGGAVAVDAVDANRKTRCYDGPAAWDKIMRKILRLN